MTYLVFSTLYFLFLYLPIVLILYYIVPLKGRNAMLLVVNLVFYCWGEPVYILIMFASIAIDYTHGMLVVRARAKGNDKAARMAVASSVMFNLALLFFFKYWDFLAGSFAAIGLDFMPKLGIPLPIGISFYTFQTMSYTIDVYRGDARVQKNLVTFATFVTLFPQLIAGPIIQYKDVDEQLERRTHSPEQFASGVEVFVAGLAKKVLLANNIGSLWDACKALPDGQLTVLGAWLGIIAFTFQIYFDFSGYSDMAAGLGRMLGFEFIRNFNYPYISKSITEFWRRWHISLGSWFREYLYIPLGGNRVSRPRLLLNLMIVWAATGIWHGANWTFLLWGLYYGVLLALEKLVWGKGLEKLPAVLRHIYTMTLVILGWVLFDLDTLGQVGAYSKAMLGLSGAGLADGWALYQLASYLPTLAILAAASTPLPAELWKMLPEKAAKTVLPVLLLLGLFFSTAYLVDATYNPFLYFRF